MGVHIIASWFGSCNQSAYSKPRASCIIRTNIRGGETLPPLPKVVTKLALITPCSTFHPNKVSQTLIQLTWPTSARCKGCPHLGQGMNSHKVLPTVNKQHRSSRYLLVWRQGTLGMMPAPQRLQPATHQSAKCTRSSNAR